MRAAVVLAGVVACNSYDPLDDVSYRDYPDTATAIRAILDDAGHPHVYAIGEYHPTGPVAATPLARFTAEILPVLEPYASHLVVEAWFDARCVGGGDSVENQIQAVTHRPPQQQTDLAALADHMQTHGLAMTCIEHGSVLDARGHVDFYRLLAMVAEKLAEATRAVIADGRDVIVYGGALHNDLYPPWPLEELAYGHVLARETSVLELDLVVPEVVAPMTVLWREPWFPIVTEASRDRAYFWERGPNSYVVILPGAIVAR